LSGKRPREASPDTHGKLPRVTPAKPPAPPTIDPRPSADAVPASTAARDEQLCRQAAAARHKWFLSERRVSCAEKGVDRSNREHTAMNPHDVHALASYIFQVGCDTFEFNRCVAVMLPNASADDEDEKEVQQNISLHNSEVQHNISLHNSSSLFPEMTRERAEMLTMTTIVGSHANMVNRCFFFGVGCAHKDHADSRGMMAMDFLRGCDERWADSIVDGAMTTILKARIRTADPEGMAAISRADNVKHGANLVQHSLRLIKRMWHFHKAEESLSTTVLKGTVTRRFCATVGVERLVDVDYYFDLARILGDSGGMEELSEFVSHFKLERKEVEGSYYGKAATLPLPLKRVRVAVLIAQLTCGAAFMVQNVCRFISARELDALKPGGSKANDAAICEAFLRQFRDHYKQVLLALPAAERTSVIAIVDSGAARVLLTKPCKFASFPEVGREGHASLVEKAATLTAASGWPAEIPDMPACPWPEEPLDVPELGTPRPSASAPRPPASAPVPAEGAVKYDGDQPRADFLAADRGLVKDALLDVVLEDSLLPPAMPLGSRWKVLMLHQPETDGEWWVTLAPPDDDSHEISAPLNAVLEACKLADKRAPEEWLEPGSYETSTAMMDSRKSRLFLAMQLLHARAQEAEADVRIRVSPKLGVFAHKPVKAKTVFPIVSGTVHVFATEELKGDVLHSTQLKGDVFHSTRELHITPQKAGKRSTSLGARFKGRGKGTFDDNTWHANVASCVRIVTAEEASQEGTHRMQRC